MNGWNINCDMHGDNAALHVRLGFFMSSCLCCHKIIVTLWFYPFTLVLHGESSKRLAPPRNTQDRKNLQSTQSTINHSSVTMLGWTFVRHAYRPVNGKSFKLGSHCNCIMARQVDDQPRRKYLRAAAACSTTVAADLGSNVIGSTPGQPSASSACTC